VQAYRAALSGLNVTIEHQWPGQIVTGFTYFTNFGNQHYNKPMNNIDPRLQQQYQNTLNTTQVPNPFYHYQNQTLIPGPLFNQQTVTLGSLLTKAKNGATVLEATARTGAPRMAARIVEPIFRE